MQGTLSVISIAAGAILCTGAYFQAHASEPAQQFYEERPPEYLDPVENYLYVKANELSEISAVLERLRMHEDIDAFYGLIESNAMFADYNLVGDTVEQRALVAEALGHTTSHYLSSVGATMKKVETSKSVGFDVVRSATKVVGGGAEFDDFAAVGEAMLHGTVEGLQHSTSGDLVTIRVIDGSSDMGSKLITYRTHRGGVQPGQECMFFVSRSLSLFNSERNGSAAPASRLVEQFAPFCRTETGYASTSHYTTAEVSATGALSALAAKKLVSERP